MGKAEAQVVPMSDAEREAQASRQTVSEWVEMIDRVDDDRIGEWYQKPEGYESWIFYRCGRRDSPAAMALAQQLRNMGARDAPAGVQCRGYETDGELAVYVCWPPDAYAAMRRYKVEHARRASDRRSSQWERDVDDLHDRLRRRGGSASVEGSQNLR